MPQDKTKKDLFNHRKGFQVFGVSGVAAPTLPGLGANRLIGKKQLKGKRLH